MSPDRGYPGTILDFLLDRIASGMREDMIMAQFKKIWGSSITHEEIMSIIEGHESELPDRRKQAADKIKNLGLVEIYADVVQDCYDSIRTAPTPKEKIAFLNTLHSYLAIYLKTAEQKEISIKASTSPESVIALLDNLTEGATKAAENEIVSINAKNESANIHKEPQLFSIQGDKEKRKPQSQKSGDKEKAEKGTGVTDGHGGSVKPRAEDKSTESDSESEERFTQEEELEPNAAPSP